MFQETTNKTVSKNIHVWGLSEAREYQEKTNLAIPRNA